MIKLSAENGWVAKDQYGIQYPWYASDMLELLDKMDLRGKYVFEYGCGHSTHWFRSRGAFVDGVDSDIDWADVAKVKFEKYYNEYTNRIHNSKYEWYDIIVIDGIYRDDCTEHALKNLKPGGMLIIDNWMQPSVEPNEWTRTLELTKGMKSEVFAQEGHPDWKTIYFIKP